MTEPKTLKQLAENLAKETVGLNCNCNIPGGCANDRDPYKMNVQSALLSFGEAVLERVEVKEETTCSTGDTVKVTTNIDDLRKELK